MPFYRLNNGKVELCSREQYVETHGEPPPRTGEKVLPIGCNIDRTDFEGGVRVLTMFNGFAKKNDLSPRLFYTYVFHSKRCIDEHKSATLGEAKQKHWDCIDRILASGVKQIEKQDE